MNSFKSFMTKVGERVQEVTAQGPFNNDNLNKKSEEVEGFVCPSCFQSFKTPDLLEEHYSVTHLEPSANYLCPVCKARLWSQSELEQHYSSNHGNKDLTEHSIEALKEEIVELSTNLQEEKWFSEELQKEVERLQNAFKKKGTENDAEAYVHQSQVDALEESKKLLTSEVLVLRKQLAEALQQTSSLRIENETLDQKKNDLLRAVDEQKSLMMTLEAENETTNAEKSKYEAMVHEMEENRSQEISLLKQNIEEFKSTLSDRENTIADMERTKEELSYHLENSDSVLAELKEELRESKFQLSLKQQELSKIKMDDNLQADKDAKRDCVVEAEMQEQLKANLKLVDDLEEKLSSMKISLERKERKVSDVLKDLEKANERIQFLLKENDVIHELKSNLTKLSDEKCHLVAEVERQISQRNLAETHQIETEKQFTSLQDQIKNLKSENDESCGQINSYKLDIKERDENIDSLKAQLKSIEEYNDTTRRYCQSLSVESAQLDLEIKTLKKTLEESKTSFDNERNELTTKLTDCENQLATARLDQSELESKFSWKENELREAYKSVEDVKNEMLKTVARLESEGKHARKKYDSEVNSLKSENESLKQQCQAITDELRASSVELKSKVDSETTLKESLLNYESVISKHKDSQKELQKDIAQYQKQIESLSEVSSTHKTIVSELEGRLANQEAELVSLAGDKLELEVKAEASVEERRSLLERCVAAEAEAERLQSQLTHVRRKLDDSTAALHELGRENQSLQMDNAKLSGRKWTEDSEVKSCQNCDKSFSMTVRKHHCRNCYKIFCNDCSSKQISLDAHKRPVRTCDSCYSEIAAKN